MGRLAIIAIMTAPTTSANLLALLEEQARHDLMRLNYPGANWMPLANDAAGKPVLDVLVVGAGMCGKPQRSRCCEKACAICA